MSVILTILEVYYIYAHILILYISQFSFQRTLYNQSTETYLNSVPVLNIHTWNDLAIAVCLVLDIYAQNHKIFWSDEGGNFNEISLIILGAKVLHCERGKDKEASGKIKVQEAKSGKTKLIVC